MSHDQIVGVFCVLASVNTVVLAYQCRAFWKSSDSFLEFVWDDAFAQGVEAGRKIADGEAPPEA